MTTRNKFQLFRGKNRQFYFRLKAGNGEIVLASQGYRSKSAALRGIASVMVNARQDKRFSRRLAANRMHYFVLTARNGRIIGMSELYASRSGREKGIQSVRKAAENARIDDAG